MIKLAGIAKGLIKEAVAKPNTILVTSIDNGNSYINYPNGEELDSNHYDQAIEFAEEKYSNGTNIEFIYMDVDGKAHEGKVKLNARSDYEGPDWDDEKEFQSTMMSDENIIDMFDEFS
jgi:hypothetical protein